MLTNAQWLKEGINWDRTDSTILGELVISPDINRVVKFRVIKHSDGGYSIYHQVCGGGGQFQFDTEGQVKGYLEAQLNAKQEWLKLISKRDALTSRYQPLHKKLNIINAQIDAILFAK